MESIPDSSDSPLSPERVDDSPSSGFSGRGYDSFAEGCTSRPVKSPSF